MKRSAGEISLVPREVTTVTSTVEPEPVLTATDVGPIAPPTVIPGDRKPEPIAPGFLSILDPSPARIEPSPAAPRSTGRRLALARWLTRPDNPLSTRVVVNGVGSVDEVAIRVLRVYEERLGG